MKIHFDVSFLLVGLLRSLPILAQPLGNESPGVGTALVWRTFREVDTLLANPSQGWMSQARSPRADPRFPCSVACVRFNWADIEPDQGKYNWQVIDDVVSAWKPRGATVAFRVMTCNAHSAGYYASPKWLFDAGCKGFDYLQSKGWSVDAAVNFMLNNHVTLIKDNVGRVPPEAMAKIERLARLAGARLVLREVAHEKEVKRGALLHVETKWMNVGVGKLYRQCALRYSLVDSAGRPYVVADAEAEVLQWLPGEHTVAEALQLPTTLEPGDCDLVVAIVDPAGARRSFPLAIDAPERDGRYTVSQIRIR